MKPPIKLSDPKDAKRFVVGQTFWSPDGKNWTLGEPPPTEPTVATLVVTDVDRRTGTITVRGTDQVA